jgi:hypothetical protein
VDGFSELPEDLCARPPQTDARFILTTGEKNRCFLPQSQLRTFEWLERHRKNYHTLQLFPNYSHLDVLMGKRAAQDTFPAILAALDG